MQFQHVLFPVDFSPQCQQVVPAVQYVIGRFQSRLTLLHAIERNGGSRPEASGQQDLPERNDLAPEQQAKLMAFQAEHFRSNPVHIVVENNTPERAIAEYAQRHSVDLIMMPTHGYGPLHAALLGSVTGKIIHDTTCPVWTSVHTEKIHNPSYPYRLIVCAIDELESSIDTIRGAGQIASAFESSLVIAHAAPAKASSTESEIRSRLEQLGMSGDVSVPIRIGSGDVVGVVTETAMREGADLVIIGRGRSSGALGILRSHVYSLIRESPCPVLTI
jgi:nucleotide-binding universal stress UspA family protein